MLRGWERDIPPALPRRLSPGDGQAPACGGRLLWSQSLARRQGWGHSDEV